MSNQEIINRANELARLFYESHGYQVQPGYRFDENAALNVLSAGRAVWASTSAVAGVAQEAAGL